MAEFLLPRIVSKSPKVQAIQMCLDAEISRMVKVYPGIEKILVKDPLDNIIISKKLIKVRGDLANAAYKDLDIYLYDSFLTASGRLAFGRSYVDSSPEGLFRHELGHHIYFQIPTTRYIQWETLYNARSKEEWSKTISRLASNSHKELFAEVFCAMTHPIYKKGTFPKDIESVMFAILSKGI
jgi:hypothetical protein